MPLSDVGRAQARALAEALALTVFTRAYASDLERAVETAEAIAVPHGIGVRTDVRLREFDFGAWEGLTWAEIVVRWPEQKDHHYTSARMYHPVGGETFDAVVERVRSFFRELTGAPNERILIVAHAGALHAVIEALGILPPAPISFSTASITRVAMDAGKARLISLNDVSHLDPVA